MSGKKVPEGIVQKVLRLEQAVMFEEQQGGWCYWSGRQEARGGRHVARK